MATYTYTGRVVDFSEQPFPGATPRLRVRPEGPSFGPAGFYADRDIPAPLGADGSFSVALTASPDLSPPRSYTLVAEWLTSNESGQEIVTGWAEVSFYAVVGGGQIKDMVDAAPSIWWVGPPWPANLPRGFYLDTETNDVGERGI